MKKEQRTRKRLLPAIVSAACAAVLGAGLILSAGAADGDLVSKTDWTATGAYIAASGTTWDVQFGVGPDAQDYITFDEAYANTEYSFNGSAWFKASVFPNPAYVDETTTATEPKTIVRANITKQLKADKGTTDQALTVYLRRASSNPDDPAVAGIDNFLPVANVGKQAVEGVSVQPNSTAANAGYISIPVSRDAAPKVAASWKTVKITDMAESIDGISKVKADSMDKQKDVTFSATDNLAYVKPGDKDRTYYFWTPDALEPVTVDIASTATTYGTADLTDLLASDSAVKVSVAYQEKELDAVVAVGTTSYGPMSKVATLSVGARAAAPKVTIDWTNGTFKGTKIGTEYMSFTPAGADASADPAVWSYNGISDVANLSIDSLPDPTATYAAFRTAATYNKRASAWKVIAIPAVGDAPQGLSTVKLDGKNYLKMTLMTYDADTPAAITDYAQLVKDDVGQDVVGKSKVTTTNGTTSMLPYKFGGNDLNGFQYRVIREVSEVDDKGTPEETDDVTIITEEIVKKWTAITWKPMEGGGTNPDYAVFDISGAAFTGEGAVLQVRIKAFPKEKDGVKPYIPTRYVSMSPKPGFVAVSDVTLTTATTATVGDTLTLAATVTPAEATNKDIEWSLVSASTDAAGAAIDANDKLTVTGAGKVTVQAKIDAGATESSSFTKTFEITFTGGETPTPDPDDGDYKAVTDITLTSANSTTVGNLTLAATVTPADAADTTIVWSVKTAGDTGATISGSVLTTTGAGTVTVTATIANGEGEGDPFAKDFDITVNAATPTSVAVTKIEADFAESYAADASITLADDIELTFTPTGATNTDELVWAVADAGETGAKITEGVLSFTGGGTATITATVKEYTETFTLTVTAVTTTPEGGA